ncbi:212_t:CDS:2, partial [Acaulospora morrowiae]
EKSKRNNHDRNKSSEARSSDREYNIRDYKHSHSSKRTKKEYSSRYYSASPSRSSDDYQSSSKRHKKKHEHYGHEERSSQSFDDRKRRYVERLFQDRGIPRPLPSERESPKPTEKIPKEFKNLDPLKAEARQDAKKKAKSASKEKKEKRLKEKSKFVESIDVQEETSEEAIREKTREFNALLDQNPKDVNLWLEFIEFQDKSMQFGKSKKADAAATRLSINEVKLSIFEKSFEANPNDPTLLVAYLKCCEQVWDVPRLLTKWDQILKENPRNVTLWMQYLNFRQTNLVSFTVTQCIQVFEECFHTLRKEVLASPNYEDRLRIERIMIHVFQRACFLMFQSGYAERAYACWQAMIEFTFFIPESLRNQVFYDRVAAFESFWEAGWARFGEDDAKGWHYYFNQ